MLGGFFVVNLFLAVIFDEFVMAFEVLSAKVAACARRVYMTVARHVHVPMLRSAIHLDDA